MQVLVNKSAVIKEQLLQKLVDDGEKDESEAARAGRRKVMMIAI